MAEQKNPSMSDRVHQLRIFIQVAEMSSFVGAARALKLPPATVSAAMKMLEADLGVRLLHRTTRQVSLTAEGEKILPMAHKITSDLDDIYSALHSDWHAVSGRFTLSVPSRIATRLIAPALPAFLQRHPALELHVLSSDRNFDLVSDGIDCVVRVGHAQDEAVPSRPLGLLEMIHCASPSYLAAYGTPQHPDELARHWAVGYSPSNAMQPAIWSGVGVSGVPKSISMKHRVVVNNMESYLASGRVGMGLIQVPRFDVQDLLTSGELVEVLPNWPPPPTPVAALYLRRHQRSRRLAAVIDWLQELLNRALA